MKSVFYGIIIFCVFTYCSFAIYNNYFHPLQTLKLEIEVGQNCSQAVELTNSYTVKNFLFFKPHYNVIDPIYRDLETLKGSTTASGHFIYHGPALFGLGAVLKFRCSSLNNLVDQVVFN